MFSAYHQQGATWAAASEARIFTPTLDFSSGLVFSAYTVEGRCSNALFCAHSPIPLSPQSVLVSGGKERMQVTSYFAIIILADGNCMVLIRVSCII